MRVRRPPSSSPPLSLGILAFLAACTGTKPVETATTVGDSIVGETDTVSNMLIDADGDGYLASEDCDDTNPEINPGASEICDGIDNDCNGLVDEDDPYLDNSSKIECYGDADGDGYGVDTSLTYACTPPEGFAAADGDCDDSNAAINPGAVEVCDSLDNDCNGLVDDDAVDGGYYYPDEDGDGLGAQGELVLSCSGAVEPYDCDDTDPTEPQVVNASATGLTAGSYAFPWVNIQDGIDNADECVLVFGGTYTEAINFSGKSISVVGAEGSGKTTIDATGLGTAAVTMDTGEGSGTVLSGFTIIGGTGNLDDTSTSYSCGSLLTCTDYTSTYCGGGIYIDGATPTLSDLVITGNTLPAASTSTSTTSSGTTTYYVNTFGGGICMMNAAASISDVKIDGNYADQGGGIYLDEESQADVSQSWIVANTATDGGGIAVDGGSITLTNVGSTWNAASGQGGGLYIGDGEVTATNVTWGGDDAPAGGGLSATGAANLTLDSVLIYGAATGEGIQVTGTGTLTVTYSDLYDDAGGRVTGATDPAGHSGNITADPMFVAFSADGDATDDDWHLEAASSCVNTGNPDPTYNDADGTANDMGVYGGPGGTF